MVNHSNTSVFLQQGEENSIFNSEFFLWLLITMVLVTSVLLDCALIYYEDRVNWIKKKLALLEALINDYDQLVEEAGQLKLKAREFWGSEDLSRIHQWLREDEREWVKSTKEVVREAKACITSYNSQSRGLIHGCATAVFRLIPIIDVICRIRPVERNVRDHLDKKDEVAKDIYHSMQESRSMNRNLLDQYATEEGQETIKSETVAAKHQKHREPSTSIDELMKKSNDLFSGMEERWSMYLLLPLHAFTKDLSQIRLETETEKLWKTEAEELIAEAEVFISNYSWWVSSFSSIRIFKENFKNAVAPLFRQDIKRIVNAFYDLLDRKNKYKFDFFDRAATKSVFPYQNTDDADAITSAVKSIRSKLDQSVSRQVAEMKSLCDALEGMHNELQKTKETARRKACLEQLKSIAQEVDHSLSNFLVKQMKKPELNRLEQIKKAKDLLQKIMKTCYIKRQESTQVVGLKNAVRELVSKLTTSSDNLLTLSIVGMWGVGKKTLAEAIYYNTDVVNHFPIRVWVTEGAASKVQVLLMKQDGTKDQTLSITEVRDHLKGKLCLIVLHNVSKTEDFDKLKKELMSENEMTNGSRIVLTTRFKNVALHADTSGNPHQIRLLTKEESWALFQKVTEKVKPKLNSKEEKLAKKVVGRCGGLPLAIVSVGLLMTVKGSMTEDNLRRVLDQINHGHNKAPWLQAWENTKKELSETLSNCLDYLTLFPVDFEIPVRRLVNLWEAEGLVKQNEGFDENQETSKYTAERCLEELRDCNMIQEVALKSNGKIKTCRLPILLREIILQDSKRTSHSQYSSTHLERRFAYRFDDRGLDANSANVFSKKRIPLSVFFFDRREGSKPGEHIERILSTGIASEQFMEITVLDLERVFRPQLPDTLGKLFHLKYLGLRWTYLEEFPAFIGKLQNLETLDAKHTCIRVFPSSIWKLKKLKNLYLNQDYRSRLEGKPSGNLQQNLHRLWGVFIYGGCPLLRELQRLKDLRKLKLSFQLTAEEQESLSKKIAQLNHLQSLRLRSINEMGNPEKLILRNMSKLEKLSSLQLYGKLEYGLCMSYLPQNLIDLTFSASKLPDDRDPMQRLQNLLKLESLCLYADSYKGRSIVCNPGSFPKLLVLRFWNLRNLEKWNVKEGALPSLTEFEARSCQKMAVPTGLKYLKNLRLIKLQEMPKIFMREILNSKKTLLGHVQIDFD